MRVLIIDCNIDPAAHGAEDLRRQVRDLPGAILIVRRAPDDDLPESPASYDRVIISGSKTSCLAEAPWIERLLAFIRTAIDGGKPVLGVCFGHQMLVRAYGGKECLRVGTNAEFGWTKLRVLENSPLFTGVPERFISFSSHFEEAASVPRGFHVLASSPDCAIQAINLAGKPVYGIQFHPEKNAEEGELLLTAKKKLGKPKKLLQRGQGKHLYKPQVAENIFGNFLKS